MRKTFAALAAATAIFALPACNGIDPIETQSTQTPVVDTRIDPSVRIEVGNGLGSGVYIGNGLVLTARHVVCEPAGAACVTDATVFTQAAGGAPYSGHVLWANKEYDVALLRLAGGTQYSQLRPANLECREPVDNEPVHAKGNPLGLRFVSIHGFVATESLEIPADVPGGAGWKSAFYVDMTTIGGMSGGALFDADNDVIGVVVGALSSVREFGYGNIGVVVPASVVCQLLGREAA